MNETLARRAAALPHVRLVAITDEQGRPRFHSREVTPAINDVSDRAFFTTQRDHPYGGVFLSEPIVTRLEKRPAVILSRRLDKPDGSFDGVVMAVVDLDEFQSLYRAIDLGAGTTIILMRDDGMLMVRQPAAEGTQGRMAPELADASHSPDGLVVSPIDHTPRFVGVEQVPGFPLLAAVTREERVALANWRNEAYHVAVRTLLLVALGVLAIMALVRQLRRVELGERALRSSEERYALAMEGANEGHWDWNFKDGPSYLSPKMKALHGRGADVPVTTRAQWMADVDVHPDDRRRLETAARDHFEGGPISSSSNTAFAIPMESGIGFWCAEGACVMRLATCTGSWDRRSTSRRARTPRKRRSVSNSNCANRKSSKRWARSQAASRTISTTFSGRSSATARWHRRERARAAPSGAISTT
jgi:PAS domain-containing protein